jgi:hypothetical protein
VIRIGLQSTEELEKAGTILAGPYHPAFRQLVDSSIFLDKMRSLLNKSSAVYKKASFAVGPRDVSSAVGQRRNNVKSLMKEFSLENVRIVADNSINGWREMRLLSR